MTDARAVARSFLAVAIGLWLWSAAPSAQSSTAAELFQRATDREAALRASTSPSAQEARRTIASYELVVRKFPKSGYCDNALWQASGVALLAFRQSNADADRQTGERLLKWLESEYPSSALAQQADERRDAFTVSGPRTASDAGSSASTRAASASPARPNRAAPPAKPTAVLTGITREALPGGDRIVLALDREVSFATDRIANPDRVFLDLSSTAVGEGLPAAAAALKGMLVTNVRLGHPTAGTTRIVFDLAASPKHSIYPLYSPYRLVIDAEGPVPPPLSKSTLHDEPLNTAGPAVQPTPAAVAPAPVVPTMPAAVITPPAPPVIAPPPAPVTTPSKPTVTASSPMPVPAMPAPAMPAVPVLPPSTTRSGDYSLARQLGLGVQRIVIDAGHGGHDPGAHGNGIVEKELVLDIALRLEALLKAQKGFDVVLTRGTDEFIPLEERTAIANRASADMFLSIHANASTRKEARGLETYFLNFATNPEAEAVAARENATSSQNMGHLPEILRAIALNAKLAESRELASMVQTSMVRRLKPQNAAVRDLGVKQAPFVVLIGAEMPSVLAEISFLTNKAEAALLKQNAYKQRIAQALFDAIMKYQTSLKKITTVATKGSQQ